MRSFVVWQGDRFTHKVLVFLHGVGEAFCPLSDVSSQKPEDVAQLGIASIFKQGLPKLLGNPASLEAGSKGPWWRRARSAAAGPGSRWGIPEYLQELLVVIPQLELREDMAQESITRSALAASLGLARALCQQEPKVGLMGFSRGGFAAAHLARDPAVAAVVTMDAAVPANADAGRTDTDVAAFRTAVQASDKPYWSFYADHEDSDYRRRITSPHALLAWPSVAPGERATHQGKTLVTTPRGDRGVKHSAVCSWVCAQEVVYAWLSQKLA